MNDTPQANRIHIAFFGLRNAGKSTLVNAFTGQNLAIVSATPGTTTDPVSKAMEILPLGPCLVTDTAGLDDVGELGAQRVRKTLDVLATTDVAVWVRGEDEKEKVGGESRWREECRRRNVVVLEYRRGDSVAALKEKIAALKIADESPGLLDGLVQAGDRVICVCPIDESAPKGRLILPQVQVIRAALDLHATCEVCQVAELAAVHPPVVHVTHEHAPCSTVRVRHAHDGQSPKQALGVTDPRSLIVTDSQAFGEVREILASSRLASSRLATSRLASPVSRPAFRLTSFSILFARQKGDLDAYVEGLAALRRLRDGDTVLIAEGCTHHRQCNDIGTVKIPKALEKLSGRKLNFTFASGGDFLADAAPSPRPPQDQPSAVHLLSSPTFFSPPALVVQCGGCMLTRREVLRRIGVARAAKIPIVNYGMILAAANGIEVVPGTCLVRLDREDAAR